MRPVSASELLDAWERSLAEPAASRALPLLAAASPDCSPDEIAALSIGERDRRLLTLREWTFGPYLFSVANCPNCGERLEWSAKAEDLCVPNQPEQVGASSLEVDGYRVSFRLPNTLDLVAASHCEEAGLARKLLIERCLSAASCGEREIDVSELPVEVAEAIVKRMAEADPQADMQLSLTCPVCSHRWQALFDIESFFWSEINAWAQRILTEVHRLASAYGWRESDILSLSAWRRQLYLNLISE